MLSLSKDTQLWSASLPIGSESLRLIEIVNQLSASVYDFQKLNLITSLDEEDESMYQYLRSLDSKSSSRNQNSSYNSPAFIFMDIKYQYIGMNILS